MRRDRNGRGCDARLRKDAARAGGDVRDEVLGRVVLAVDVDVHGRHGRAGQDVVKLRAQHDRPSLAELPARFVEEERRRVQRLRPGERVFRATERAFERGITRLHVVMRGVRAAMLLEVEFVAHDRQRVRLRPERREPALERAERPVARRFGERGVERAAAAVTFADQEQIAAFARAPHALRVERARNRVDLRGEDARAVRRFPHEARMREHGRIVPFEFRRGERVDARVAQQHRHRVGESERIREPRDARAHAELALDITDTEGELPQQRLARRQITIGFHPQRRAARIETPGTRERPDAFEELRVALGDERVELRLTLRVDEAGIRFELPDGGRERAHRLAPGLFVRPEPRDVEVRVARERQTGARSVRASRIRCGAPAHATPFDADGRRGRLRRSSEISPPPEAVAGGQTRGRQRAVLDFQRQRPRSVRTERQLRMFAIERAAHDAVQANERARPRRVPQDVRAARFCGRERFARAQRDDRAVVRDRLQTQIHERTIAAATMSGRSRCTKCPAPRTISRS